ncbi:hypothetical protein SFRURICE_009743 [Spodoptera frugiperda]|nr:hypothetical protein SFRURICE_009743 [Spodoptera frugiperda]
MNTRRYLHGNFTLLIGNVPKKYRHAFYLRMGRQRCTLRHVMPLYNVQPMFTIYEPIAIRARFQTLCYY